MFQQERQDAEGFLGEPDAYLAVTQLSGSEVELVASEADPVWLGAFHGDETCFRTKSTSLLEFPN